MSQDTSARALRAQLDAGTITPDAAIDPLARLAHGAPVRSQRLDACHLLGDIAGRAHGAGWEAAERAAFQLLSLARQADSAEDRRGVVRAMGRAFRNAWLLPFVHRRLSDADPGVVAAAINAAGGLGFPALEEAIAAFLHGKHPPALRRAATAALGRMGAMSAVARLVELVSGDAEEAAAALDALTEIRTDAAVDAAAAILEREPEREVLVAAMRYLAELGSLAVLPTLRRLARDDDAQLRLAASFASRTLKAERDRDAGERFLIALTERDRAVRAVLARRLRTIPITEVLEHAYVLISEDASGVVQVLGELRDEEVTRHLLGLARQDDLELVVRARAVGAIEANLPWERELVAALACDAAAPLEVRAAAAQTLGAFATPAELFTRIGALAGAAEAELRGAFLWALQLAGRPGALDAATRPRTIAAVQPLLADADVAVRRRAAYAVGNLELPELAPQLVALAKGDARADVRLAAFVGLAELAAPAVFDDVLALARKEADPAAFAAASRALAALVLGAKERLDVSSLASKLGQLMGSDDALVREAAVRLAGLARGSVAAPAIAKLADDPVPAVRAEALTALGRLAAAAAATDEKTLIAAFEDADPALHERAAEALLSVGGRRPLEQVLRFVSGEGDEEARATIAPRIVVPPTEVAHFLPLVDAALDRVGSDDATYEPLLDLKVTLLEAGRAGKEDPAALDAGIAQVFPSFAHMAKLRGFEQLVKSIRTAESLYRTVVGVTEGDMSPPIVLWMKVLENYVHAWLGARMNTLQRDPLALFAHVDELVAGAWPKYQPFVSKLWPDPMVVGQARVELPVRSLPNVLRDFQEHKRKRLDSPLSVTEWARMMVFLGVDHPSGVKNLWKLPVKSADQAVRLAHRLHTLAAVRNLVTHRAAASGQTLEAFRKGYYAAFEDLAQMA